MFDDRSFSMVSFDARSFDFGPAVIVPDAPDRLPVSRFVALDLPIIGASHGHDYLRLAERYSRRRPRL